MPIPNLAWVLPRPRKDKYRGGFPLHAEIKILREIGADPRLTDKTIVHPFGGRAEWGLRGDLSRDCHPDAIWDAHCLPLPDECFDVVFLDPPYNAEYALSLYDAPKPVYSKYVKEAIRIL